MQYQRTKENEPRRETSKEAQATTERALRLLEILRPPVHATSSHTDES